MQDTACGQELQHSLVKRQRAKALSPLQCLKADQRAAVVSARAAGKLVRVDSSEIGGSEASRHLRTARKAKVMSPQRFWVRFNIKLILTSNIVSKPNLTDPSCLDQCNLKTRFIMAQIWKYEAKTNKCCHLF